jgi:D-alanyl-D-alanine carboxypeptidase
MLARAGFLAGALVFLATTSAVAEGLPGASLQAILDKAVADGVPGAVMRVETADGEVWTGAAGSAGTAGERLTPNSLFRLFSISKMVTAATAFTLVDEGKLRLDDPIAKWLGDDLISALPNSGTVTVRQLISQTSGIRDYADERFLGLIRENFARVWAPAELVALAADGEPFAPPGDAASYYSNTNYTLLGLVIEKAAGMPLAKAIRTRVLRPLGAERTYSWEEAGRPDPVPGYLLDGEKLTDVSTIDLSISWGAGGLLSTAEDTAKIARGILAGTLLSPASRALMTTDFRPLVGRKVEYGYGSFRVPLFDPAPVGHSGEGPGAGTLAVWWPDTGNVLVILTNLDAGAHFGMMQEVGALLGQ